MSQSWKTLLVCSLFAAGLAGCRQDPFMQAYLEEVHGQMRQLEDELYDLQYEYEALEEELERCRAGQEASDRPGARPNRDRSEPGRRNGILRDLLPRENGSRDPVPPGLLPDDIVPPQVQPGREVEPPGIDPMQDEDEESASPGRRPGGSDMLPEVEILPAQTPLPRPISGPPTAASPTSSAPVSHIRLHPTWTGGLELDGEPGDDGLSILVQPRDADERPVDEPGEIAAVVLDEQLQEAGMDALVGRWEWSSDEAAIALRRIPEPGQQGIRLELPWQAGPPENARLHLFVRFTTGSGEVFEASRIVVVNLPGQVTARWTPRAHNHDVARQSPPASGRPEPTTPRRPAANPDWQPDRR